jgi:hypothetical protein
MDARDLLRTQLQFASRTLGLAIADVDDEMAHRQPAGTIQPIATIYAHLLADLDFILHTTLRERPLLLEREGWTERTGIVAPAGLVMTPQWLASLSVNMAEAQAYATALFAAVDDALATMPVTALDREIEGLTGRSTVAQRLGGVGVTHVAHHTGEIAALKGIAGLKGLPF